ncbi:hypothetical protein CEUSTIGMA_g13086.t1 [Chlamydomonas eustigma]|uniref:Uncharacterized protein n=1 Tax=Chlamydomonas eustigma TaxID=1157962 RepID=A0A250XRF8_9CHLO|nr:hypothetical protein CEUSTIGMA_g13086.t1 [Chlamydomonas eustigma]|eukprot:GAX85671.1 hypothetical protein CEUSTIGMA_g13086.t1 [Chlamydomonas eustigma]
MASFLILPDDDTADDVRAMLRSSGASCQPVENGMLHVGSRTLYVCRREDVVLRVCKVESGGRVVPQRVEVPVYTALMRPRSVVPIVPRVGNEIPVIQAADAGGDIDDIDDIILGLRKQQKRAKLSAPPQRAFKPPSRFNRDRQEAHRSMLSSVQEVELIRSALQAAGEESCDRAFISERLPTRTKKYVDRLISNEFETVPGRPDMFRPPFDDEKFRGLMTSSVSGVVTIGLDVFGVTKLGLSVPASAAVFLYGLGSIISYTLDIMFAKQSFGGVPVAYDDLSRRFRWLVRSFASRHYYRLLFCLIIETLTGLAVLRAVLDAMNSHGILVDWAPRDFVAGVLVAVLTFLLFGNVIRFDWAYVEVEHPLMNLVVLMWMVLTILVFSSTNENK